MFERLFFGTYGSNTALYQSESVAFLTRYGITMRSVSLKTLSSMELKILTVFVKSTGSSNRHGTQYMCNALFYEFFNKVSYFKYKLNIYYDKRTYVSSKISVFFLRFYQLQKFLVKSSKIMFHETPLWQRICLCRKQ